MDRLSLEEEEEGVTWEVPQEIQDENRRLVPEVAISLVARQGIYPERGPLDIEAQNWAAHREIQDEMDFLKTSEAWTWWCPSENRAHADLSLLLQEEVHRLPETMGHRLRFIEATRAENRRSAI